MGFSEYIPLLEVSGLALGLSLISGAILTYVYAPKEAKAIYYTLRHPSEVRRLRKAEESGEVIQPSDFPFARRFGVVDNTPYRVLGESRIIYSTDGPYRVFKDGRVKFLDAIFNPETKPQ